MTRTASPAYGVYISQLIRYGRACSNYEDFIARGQLLTTRLQQQGYPTPRLKSTFRKFFGRQHDIVGVYEKSASGNRWIYTMLGAFSVVQFVIIMYALDNVGVHHTFSSQYSQLRYIYADNSTNMEEFIKQLDIIKITNETLFRNIVDLVLKKNTKKMISFLSRESEGLHLMPNDHKQEMIEIIDARLKNLLMTTYPIITRKAVSLKSKVEPSKLGKQKQVKIVKNLIKQFTIGSCQINSSTLNGQEKLSMVIQSMAELKEKFDNMINGGRWKPRDCERPLRIAIIIPFRDRDGDLKILLNNLIPKLRRQKVDYTFYVAEQADGTNFNRGLMRNIGFNEARKMDKYDCYIFNDVDTIIENDYNFYTCKQGAAYHISVRINKHKYRHLYKKLVGGILSFKEELFLKTNGYSNLFFFWGGEDDNMEGRIKAVDSEVLRPDPKISHTTTLYHKRDKTINHRLRIKFVQESLLFSEKDGLSTLEYTRHILEKNTMYTWIYASVNEDKYKKMLEQYQSELKANMVTTTISQTEPITSVTQLKPTTAVSKSKPTTIAKTPKPSTPVSNTIPSNEVQKPKPSNEVPKPKPSNEVQKPKPANEVQKPKPANEVQKPKPSNEVPKPKPSNEVPKPKPSNEVPKPKPSNEVPKPNPTKAVPKPRTTKKIQKAKPSNEIPKLNPTKAVPKPKTTKNIQKAKPSKTEPIEIVKNIKET